MVFGGMPGFPMRMPQQHVGVSTPMQPMGYFCMAQAPMQQMGWPMPGMPMQQMQQMGWPMQAQPMAGAFPPLGQAGMSLTDAPGSGLTQPQTGAAARDRSRSRSRDHSRQPVFPDDDSRIRAQKALGCSWLHGKDRVTAKKFRASLITSAMPEQYSMLSLARLSCEETDILLFVVAGVAPVIRPGDFGVENKRGARKVVRTEHQRKMKRCPGRLAQLSDDLDNLFLIAMELGYKSEWLSPSFRTHWQQDCGTHGVALTQGHPQLMLGNGAATETIAASLHPGVSQPPTSARQPGTDVVQADPRI